MPPAHLRLVTPPPGVSAPSSDADELAELLAGLRERKASAERRVFERFSPLVERILIRILGSSAEVEDLAQEVFLRVFERADRVREAGALRGFVASVTVFVAREAIRRKRRRRWLFFLPSEEMPEVESHGSDPEAREAVAAFYELLAKLPDDERIALCLRYVDGMEVLEVAGATQASPSTVKRRLRNAESRFAKLAAQRPELAELCKEGSRWPSRA